MSTTTDSLVNLIHSLTKAEKRSFKLYATRNSSSSDELKFLQLFDFIDKSKISLSKYLSGNKTKNNKEFIIEAQFVDYFKNIPSAYELIRKLYLGSILSSYIEYKAENINTTKTTELLLVFPQIRFVGTTIM